MMTSGDEEACCSFEIRYIYEKHSIVGSVFLFVCICSRRRWVVCVVGVEFISEI